MLFRTFSLIITVVMAATFPAIMSARPFAVTHIGSNSGLSSNSVKAICQDHFGLMWFGTKNGLNRYDGVSIRPYMVYDKKENRGNNNVSALYEDSKGNLWVGTDRGIYIFDPKYETFSVVSTKSAGGVSPEDWVQDICADKNGNVWALIPNQGAFRFHGDKVDFYSITNHNGSRNLIPARLISTDRGEVFVTTESSGLFFYDRDTNRFMNIGANRSGFEGLAGNPIPAIVDDHRGTIFLILQNGKAYTFSVNTATLSDFKIPFDTDDIYVRTAAMVDNELWIGTAEGLYVLDMTTNAIERLSNEERGFNRIPDNIIVSLTCDSDKNMWVGTMYGGVAHLRRHGLVFENFTRVNLPYNVVPERVRGMATDSEGRIWVGSEESGLHILNPATNEIIMPDYPVGNHKTCLFIKRNGDKMLAGFHRMGYLEFSGTTFNRVIADNILDGPTSAYSYLKDSKGNEWIAADWGVYVRHPGETDYSQVKAMGMTWVNKILEDSRGIVWFASIGNGIWAFDTSGNKLRHYPFYEDHRNGLRSNSVNSVMEDSKGRIWFSTERGGLARYMPASDNFRSYGLEEGLPDDMVYQVLEDNKGFLWFGTARGLVKFNPSTGGMKVFNKSNGLGVTQFNYAAATKGINGKFYMGGIDGIVAFNPAFDSNCDSLPPVYVTRFRAGNTDMMVKSPGFDNPVNVLYADEIVIPNGMNNFSIGIATPSYDTHNTMIYSYRLLPKDKAWTTVTDPSNLTFVGIAPGKYTLELRAQSDDVESVRAIAINVLPPWYRSTWALVSFVFLGVAALVAAFCFYRKNQQIKLKEKEQFFTISKEKEIYKSKMRFFTEIAHEIRTPLTLIGAPLEAIEEIGVDSSQVNKYISVIRQNTDRLLNLTTQLLDFQKLGNDHPDLRYENVDVTELLRKTIARFETTIVHKDKTLTVNIPSVPVFAVIDREAITKIISNLLNNALKYSLSEISVTLSEDGKNFRLEVVSDGNKIEGENVYHIFEPFYQIDKNGYNQGVGIGLPLTRTLASMHGGTIELENIEGPYNTFVLTIPLKQEGMVVDKVEASPTMAEYVMDDETLLTSTEAGYSLLFVDDNDEMREFLYEQLSKSFVVETAAGGEEALGKLKERKFDIIVTDIMMPEMDGYEFCRRVKEDSDLSHIPVVFLTAKNDLESKVKALKTGGEAYIEKPFSIKYFRQQVMSLLDNRRHERKAFLNKPFFSVDNMKLNKAEEEFMNRVIEIINKNIDDETFSVEAMADQLCMSRSSLLRKIKTIYNLSPVELIRLVRLKKAAELIQEGKYRIADVCFMVGINSSSYFSKLFYKQFGVTPKAFEKQCQNSTQIILTTTSPASTRRKRGDSARSEDMELVDGNKDKTNESQI